MAQVRSRRQNGNLLFYEGHPHRILQAIGPECWNYELRPDMLNATTVDPTGWTTTVVEVGAGTTEFDVNNQATRVGTITCAANENDGGSYQLLGENLGCPSTVGWYAGMKAQINDVDQTDFFFGAAIVDTALLGGVTDALYFESLDGAATVSVVAEKNSSETTGGTTATIADATDFTLDLLWDGTRVYAYVDGTQIYAAIPANLPDDEALRLSLEFLTGEAIANTMNVGWLRASRWSV